MKKILKLIPFLAMLLMLMAFAACGGEGKVTLKFDSDGGAAVSEMTVEAGSEITLPEPSGNKEADGEEYAFDGWISPNGEVVRGTITAPEEDTTYRAKWTKIEKTVGYAIEIYVSALDGTGYAQDTALTVTGSGKVGETPQIPQLKGLLFNAEHGSNVMPGALSKEESENEFRLYYDREEYYYDYDAGLSTGVAVTGEMTGGAALFGAKITLQQNGYAAKGYRFLGWSSAPNGGVEYLPGAEVEIESNKIFYAVWEKGYYDRLGGSDDIFFPEDEEGVAILVRGGAEFRGTREGTHFVIGDLQGEVHGDSFVYYNTELKGTYPLIDFNRANAPEFKADPAGVIHNDFTLTVDEYLNGTFKGKDADGNDFTLTGPISYDADVGDYFLTVEGEALYFTFGTLTPETGDPVGGFSLRGEEGYATGFYYQAIPHGEGAVIGNFAAYFDGYGTFLLIDTNYFDEYQGYYYILDSYYDENNGNIFKMIGVVSDDWGNLGYLPGTLVSYEFYTREIEGAYYFIQKDGSQGKYEGERGEQLELDGFGILPDSARYEADGKVYEGFYVYSTSEVFGDEVTVELYETEDGETIGDAVIKTFILESGRFTEKSAQSEEPIAEYLLFTYDEHANDGRGSPAFAMPYTSLVIYESVSNGGLKAELWTNDGKAEKAASGYVTEERFGTNLTYYIFTAESADGVYADLKTLKCMTNLTTPDGVTYYDVFYIFEYNGEARYTKHVEVDEAGDPTGGELWHMPLNEGMGSLYFSAGGRVYEGSLSWAENDFFGGYLGTFVWINYDAGQYEALYFDIAEQADLTGEFEIMAIADDARERPIYQMENGVLNTMVNFMVKGDEATGGEAVYNEAGLDAGAPTTGMFVPTDETTIFGETIYAFEVRGRVSWYFVMSDYYYAPGDLWIKVYFKANGSGIGDMSAEYPTDDGMMTLDGFHTAQLKYADGREAYGEYYIGADGKSLSFTASDGTGSYYLIEDGRLLKLDSAYGTWNLYNGIHRFYGEIEFDGRGNCTLYIERAGQEPYPMQGTYRPIESEDGMSCILTIDLGTGEAETSYYAEFRIISLLEIEIYECTIRHEDTYGIFRGDDMSVLVLDGFGAATFYDAQGHAGDAGYLEMLSAEDDFACFSSYNNYEITYFLLLDPESKSYKFLDYSGYGMTYYAGDLEGIGFGTDGNATTGFGYGPYFMTETEARVFVRDAYSGSYERHIMPLPKKNENYVLDGKTYYPWTEESAKKVTFSGEITFAGTVHEAISATLEIEMNGSAGDEMSATLSANEQTYAMNLVYITKGRIGTGVKMEEGAYLYDADYNYFPVTVHYVPDGNSSFTAEGSDAQQTVLRDGYEVDAEYNGELHHEISTLTTRYQGFGPIMLSDPIVYGKLYYDGLMDGDEPFTFEAPAKDEILIGESYSYGKLYLLPFEKDGKHYAMSYYRGTGEYELYMVMEYTVVEAENGYKVGVGKFLYSNGFTLMDIRKDDFCATVLYKDEVAIQAYDQLSYPGLNAAWLVAMGTYDQFEDTGKLGNGYWINVTFDESGEATGATVEEYTFKQGMTADGLFFVNFLVGEDGGEQLAALALLGSEGYVYVRFEDAEKTENGWKVTIGEVVYTIEFVLDESGEKQNGDYDIYGQIVPTEDGEYWIVKVSAGSK